MKKKQKKLLLTILVILLLIFIATMILFVYSAQTLENEPFVTETNILPVQKENDFPLEEKKDAVSNEEISSINEQNISNAKSPEKTESEEKLPSLEDLAIPVCKGTTDPESKNDHEVHTYSGFTLCYRESYELAEWVSYELTREELNTVTGRTNDFRADALITTQSASPADYKKSGYDRGHLAPAADMEWSVQSASESFLMSNMTPQAPSLNRGLWKTLEEQVRSWADFFGAVTVVTGPVLEKPASEYNGIGENDVKVPEYFYKALLTLLPTENGNYAATGIAFILPNKKCEGTIFDYEVTIDELEERTGIDFFALLPDSMEDDIEKSLQTSIWKSK